jgi:hypothetical protein
MTKAEGSSTASTERIYGHENAQKTQTKESDAAGKAVARARQCRTRSIRICVLCAFLWQLFLATAIENYARPTFASWGE